MADKNLRVSIVLQMAEKVLGPLKKISQGSSETAQTLKAARDQLKQLEQTQRQMTGFQRVSAELRKNNRELTAAQSQVQKYTATLEDQRTRHQAISANLRTAKQAYAQITKAYQDGKLHGEEYTRQIELARISLLANEQAHGRSKAAIEKYKAQVRNATERVSKLGESVKKGQERLDGYKQRLEAAGLSTERLAAQKRAMKGNIDTVTAAIEKQVRALKRQEEQQRKLAEIQKQAQKAAAVGAGMAGAGVASIYAGRQALRPLQATMGAFSEQENASSQLSASMMVADGSVSKEFAQIDALAKRLGDRLPGTTADFLELMAVLKQQGLADKTILGGTGEAAALLGVQLRMTAPAAGEFAAKMQDATRTAEKDMLSLMDTIQRGYYMGMDSGNMLQGFSKMSPIMGIIRKEGLEFSKTMAPLLVMMDQTGMEGGSAGNAFRKVFQSAMNKDKIDKVLKDLRKEKGIKLDFDFTDGKGEFGGLDKMYAQLEKLKSMNTQTRLSFMKDIWGDDAETLQVLNAMIDKGKAGYEEIAAKMAAQASLQQRVDQQLGTFTNVVEAAQGSATNALASIGEVMAPQLKELVGWLSDAGSAANDWIKENQTLVRWLGMASLGFAGLMVAAGFLLIPLGLLVAKSFAVRWMFAKLGLGLPSLLGGFKALGGSAVAAGKVVPSALTAIGLALQKPVKLAIAAGKAVPGALSHMWLAAKGLPSAFVGLGKAAWAGFAKAGFAAKGAAVKVWAYVLSLKAAALASARQAAASIAMYAAMRGPKGIATDALLGLKKLTAASLRAGLGMLAGAFKGLLLPIKLVGRALLMNPIGLAVTAIAGAALLIIKFWNPIKAFFAGFWQGFVQGLAPLAPMFSATFGALGGVLSALAPLWDMLVGALSTVWGWVSRLVAPFEASKQSIEGATQAGQGFGAWLADLVVTLVSIIPKFVQFGADLVSGIINGITGKLAELKDAVVGAASSAASWFKETLGIASPSKVFTQFGGWISEGAANGIEAGQAAVRAAALAMAGAAMVPVAQAESTAPSTVPIAAIKPAAPRNTAAAAVAAGTSNYNITINAAPGMDAQAIARAVAAELDRRERQSTARRNSSLHDIS